MQRHRRPRDRIRFRSSWEYLTTRDNPDVLDWLGSLWRNFVFTPFANLCGIPASPIRLISRRERPDIAC
jgi:hypothetical protein